MGSLYSTEQNDFEIEGKKDGLFEQETIFVKFTFSQQYDIKKFRQLNSNAECCNILYCGAWGNISRE